MRDFIKYIARFLLFIFLQFFVLNKVPHLHRYIVPIIYYLPLFWLPFSVSRLRLLLAGFAVGLTLDYFMMTPGLHAAACVLIMYIRPFLINLLTPKENAEFTYKEPSPLAMQWTPYAVYIFILTLPHHGYLLFLEWLSFGSFLDFIIKVITTTAISLLLTFTVELLFPRKLRFRTNTA